LTPVKIAEISTTAPTDGRSTMSEEDIIKLRQKLRELRKQFREQLKEMGAPIAEHDPFDEYDGMPTDPAFENWQRKFYERDPIATMVIQGSLLEEDLNAFIAKAFKNPEAIYGLRFYWKIQLAKAFHPKD
jgi:hypothetical protein